MTDLFNALYILLLLYLMLLLAGGIAAGIEWAMAKEKRRAGATPTRHTKNHTTIIIHQKEAEIK